MAKTDSENAEGDLKGSWTCLQRRVGGYSPFPVYLVLECMTDDAGIGGVRGAKLQSATIFFKGEEVFFYAKSADEFDSKRRDEVETQRRMLAALDDDAAYPQRCLERFQKRSAAFLELCASFARAASFSDAELIAAHARYCREYRTLSFDGEPVAFMLQEPLAEKLKAIVAKKIAAAKPKIKESLNDAMALLSTPDEPSFVKREELDLLAAAAEVAEGREKLEEAAAVHSRDFEWIEYDYEGSLLPQAHFKRLLREVIAAANGNPRSRLEALKKADAKARERRVEIEDALGLTEKEKTLFASLRACSQIMDLKKEVFTKSHVELEKLLREAGARTGFSSKELKYLAASEFPLAFKDAGKAKALYRGRAVCSLWHSKNGETSVYAGDSQEVAKFQIYVGSEAAHGALKPLESNEVIGLPASPGVARGPARVVLRADDCGRVKKGDVLISIMTTVGFVPAMKRAAAIVTDEGGVTCHAAIVARELGVPCVVGTQIATKVFKDGDTLEVKASHGIVRKVR